MPRVSILVPTRNRAESLARLLTALGLQAEQDFEVVIALDGADRSTRDLLESRKPKFPLRFVELPESRGQGAARNLAAREAQGEFLAFLDDDVLPRPDWLATHMAAQSAGGADRKLVTLANLWHSYSRPARGLREAMLRETFKARAEFNHSRLSLTPIPQAFLWIGLNTTIAAATFRTLGGYDEQLSRLGEDTDLGQRAAAFGCRFVYLPAADVEHRNERPLTSAVVESARLSGSSDVVRARDKHQALFPSAPLFALVSPGRPKRLVHIYMWRYPTLARFAATVAGVVADLFRSRRWFRIWSVLALGAAYWQGVRDSGASAADIDRIISEQRRFAGETEVRA